MLESLVRLSDSEYRAAHAAFRRAVEFFPNQAAFGDLIGTSQQNVSKLIRHGKLLPHQHLDAVELATGISRHDLRPDIYPRDDVPSVPGGGVATDGAGGTSTPARAEPGVPDSLSGLTA